MSVPVEFLQPRTAKDMKPLRKQRTSLVIPQEAKVYSPEKLQVLLKIVRTDEEKVVPCHACPRMSTVVHPGTTDSYYSYY